MEESVAPDNAPEILIVDAADIVGCYWYDVCGSVSRRDFIELITQVFCVFLNDEEGGLEGLHGLPQFNRMLDDDYLLNPKTAESIQAATLTFAHALHTRLRDLGIYQGNTFSYFFQQLIGDDLVLSHAPS